MTLISKQGEKYWKRCASSMQREFGGTIVIKIIRSSDPRCIPTECGLTNSLAASWTWQAQTWMPSRRCSSCQMEALFRPIVLKS